MSESAAKPYLIRALHEWCGDAGYTPFLRVKILDGKTWNSVQLRGYTTREAAQARLIDVQTKLGFSNLRVVQLQ